MQFAKSRLQELTITARCCPQCSRSIHTGGNPRGSFSPFLRKTPYNIAHDELLVEHISWSLAVLARMLRCLIPSSFLGPGGIRSVARVFKKLKVFLAFSESQEEFIEVFRIDQRLGGHSPIFKTWRVIERCGRYSRESVVHSLIWFTRLYTQEGSSFFGEAVPPKLIESRHSLDPSTLSTWDQLSNFCIANRYYSSDIPFLAPVSPASYAGSSDANRDPERVLTTRLLSRPKLAELW
jgi:hypothetical protein